MAAPAAQPRALAREPVQAMKVPPALWRRSQPSGESGRSLVAGAGTSASSGCLDLRTRAQNLATIRDIERRASEAFLLELRACEVLDTAEDATEADAFAKRGGTERLGTATRETMYCALMGLGEFERPRLTTTLRQEPGRGFGETAIAREASRPSTARASQSFPQGADELRRHSDRLSSSGRQRRSSAWPRTEGGSAFVGSATSRREPSGRRGSRSARAAPQCTSESTEIVDEVLGVEAQRAPTPSLRDEFMGAPDVAKSHRPSLRRPSSNGGARRPGSACSTSTRRATFPVALAAADAGAGPLGSATWTLAAAPAAAGTRGTWPLPPAHFQPAAARPSSRSVSARAAGSATSRAASRLGSATPPLAVKGQTPRPNSRGTCCGTPGSAPRRCWRPSPRLEPS